MGLPVMDYLSMPPSGPETDTSWTDDLPLCAQTGKGMKLTLKYDHKNVNSDIILYSSLFE